MTSRKIVNRSSIGLRDDSSKEGVSRIRYTDTNSSIEDLGMSKMTVPAFVDAGAYQNVERSAL